MGKIIKKRIEYGGSSNSAENIKYDDTKNVKEVINEVNSKLGNTDISAIGDGTLTGGLDALNSNLIKTKELVWQGNTIAGSQINIGKISDLIPSGATYLCTVVKYCAGESMNDPCNAIMDYSYTYLYVFPTKTQNSVIVSMIIFYR